MRPHRRQRSRSVLASLLAAVILAAAAIPAADPPATAEAAGPLAYPITRFLFRVGGNLVQRPRDYREIGRNRDRALADVAVDQQVRDYQSGRGWLSAPAYAQQQQRNDALRAGIVNLAEREKRITKKDYDHAFGREAKALAQGAVTSLPGLNPVAAKFVSNVIGGSDPLSAALSALQDPSKPYPDRLVAVQAQLGESQNAFKSLRAYVRDPDALKQELDRLKNESVILSDPGTRPPPGELEQRVNKLGEELGKTRDAAKGMWKDLTGSDVKINQERFARDDKWLALNANVQELKDTSDAKKAVVAGMTRAQIDETIADLHALVATTELTLPDEQAASLEKQAHTAIIAAMVEALKANKDWTQVDRDKILRDLIKKELGVELAPPEPAEPAEPPAAERPAEAPAEPPPAEPPAPPPAEPPTVQPPAPPPVAPPAEPPPAQPPAPPPVEPPAEPPAPVLPTITVSGATFTDGAGFSVTVSLTLDLKTGGVTGSIRGQRTSEVGAPCTSPSGQILDWSKGIVTETWQTGLGGGASGGGFSASFSGSVTASFTRTEPFDEPGGCVGLDPAYPVPGPSPLSGTLSGTVTPGGSVSFSSSLGGSWSGTGSVK